MAFTARYIKVAIVDSWVGGGNNNGIILINEFQVLNSSGTNYATGKTVTTTGNYTGSPGTSMVDGATTLNTGWATPSGSGYTPNETQYAVIDLGTTYNDIASFRYWTNNASGFSSVKNIKVYASIDNVSWTQVGAGYNPNATSTALVGPLTCSVKTKIDDMTSIGDMIICEYTATSGAFGTIKNLGSSSADIIPAASAAAPNGSFFLIYVGNDYNGCKILIADRNIQNTISWDALNTAGVTSGSGVQFNFISDSTAIPSMTSNTAPSGIASSSDSQIDAYEAFDDNFATYYNGTTLTGWLSYEFSTPKIITKYSLWHKQNLTTTGNPKDFTFEGWDGTQWVVLDRRTNVTYATTSNTKQYFTFYNTKAYIKYRINVTATVSATALLIVNMEMFESTLSPNYNFALRLLTGGISSTDKDNEWDNYIVNSTLNRTITAGDNNIWNWSGQYGWTSTTLTTNAGARVLRGSTAVSTSGSGSSSATAATSTGFRPVLVVETVFTQRYLFQDDTNIKKYAGGSWSTVGTSPVTKTMFDIDGMTDISLINNTAIQALTSNKPKLLTYATSQSVSIQSTTKAVPTAKLILANGDIDLMNVQTINSFTLTANQTGSGVVKVIASVDGGITWKTWNGSSWNIIDTSVINNVKLNGISTTNFNAITSNNWTLLVGTQKTIRFGYYLEQSSTNDAADTDLLVANLNMQGNWTVGILGTDYKYAYTSNTNLRVQLLGNGDYKINY